AALSAESGLDGPNWAEHDFGGCELGDDRLTRRLVKIAHYQAAQPNGSYSQAAGGDRYDLKGYYRFLNNPRSEMAPEQFLQSHHARTLRRMSQERTALIVQDSSDLNYATRSHCQGFAEAMKIAALLPQTRIVSIADREGDMFELFHFRRSQAGRKAELLVRAKTNRCLEGTEQKLFAELAAAPLAKRI